MVVVVVTVGTLAVTGTVTGHPVAGGCSIRHKVTSFVGKACVASSGETGSCGTSRRSDAMSGDSWVVDRSGDLSAHEWSGRKRSGSGSAVKPSTRSATLEIGSAVCVGVARRHCWQSVSVPLSQGRRDSASLLP